MCNMVCHSKGKQRWLSLLERGPKKITESTKTKVIWGSRKLPTIFIVIKNNFRVFGVCSTDREKRSA